MKSAYLKSFLFFSIIAFSVSTSLSQTEREKGIELYRSGNYAEAIRLLNQASKQKAYKSDGEIWNFIGLAYINQDEIKDGRKALEKAVKAAPQNSIYRANLAYAHLLEQKPDKAQNEINKAISLDSKNFNAYYIRGTANLWEGKNERAVADAEQTIALNPKFTAGYVLHSDALLASFGDKWADDKKSPQNDLGLLARADQSLNKCLLTCPKNDLLKKVTERADTIKAFTDYFKRQNAPKDASPPANASAQNKTPLAITGKPKPQYTDNARRNNESVNVRVAVFFGADGKTRYALVLKGLRYGLTEQALAAARGITFEPEKIDGKPVSVVKVVVFNFEIY